MRNSLFAPEKIIGSQKGSKESALNFISGGSPIGSSMLSGAKNNIVGFNRAKISPKKNNLGSLISTLTTNIFNNTNSVSNIFGDKKEKSEKIFKPFGGFFDKVKEAIGFISFFGSKKNLDKIKENIDNLKTTFTETFDVAKALRKAILKIIEQLSGFSGGGGGGGIIGAIMSALGGLVGGLIPGRGGKRPPNVSGPAMKQEGNLLSKIPKGLKGGGGIGKLLLGGAAALGTGAAISGLSQPGDEDVQPGDTAPEVPGNVLDKFNSILDRFDKALDGLRGGKGKKGSESGTGSKSSASGTTPPGTTPPGPNPTIDTSGKLSGSTAAQQAFTYFKSKGLSDEDSAAIVGNLLQENRAMDPTLTNSIGMKGIAQWDANRWSGLQAFAESKGLDPNKRETQLQYVYYEFATGKGGLGLNRLKGTPGIEAKTKLVRTDYERPGEAEANDAQRLQYAKDVMKYSGKIPTAPIAPSVEQLRKAPAARASGAESPQVSLVNVGSGTPQASPSRPSSTTTPPSPTGGNGPTAPFLPSYNSDNFLTLYSRMVYNIVG
jgi:hypothetical protein